MEPLLVLVVLGLVVVIFVLPIAAFVRSGRVAREAEQLRARITLVELELARLRTGQEQVIAALKASEAASSSRPETRPTEQPRAATPPEVREQRPQTRVPELPPPLRPRVSPIPTVRPAMPTALTSAEPAPVVPPLIPPIPLRQPAFSFEKLKGSLNWEQFMGAKLFA